MIAVRLRIDDFPDFAPLTPSTWTNWLVGALQEHGIPVDANGTVLSGELFRRSDPTDFGTVEYRWYSDAELTKT